MIEVRAMSGSPFKISTIGGVRYGEIPQSADGPTGHTFVLLHGLGNSLEFWSAVAPLLSIHSRVIAPDIPGFGQSSAPLGMALSSYRDSLESFARRIDGGPIRLVGHSMGGLLAMELATSLGEGVASLTLVDAHIFTAVSIVHAPYLGVIHPEIALNLALQFIGGSVPIGRIGANAVAHDSTTRKLLLWPFAKDPGKLDRHLVSEALEHGGGFGALRTPFIARGFDMEHLASQLSCPTRLTWGVNDALLRQQDLDKAYETMTLDWAIPIADCGHWPMLEEPEQLSRLLLK